MMDAKNEQELGSHLAMFSKLLEQIAKTIVNIPEKVSVRVEQAEGKSSLLVVVDPQDLGKIIGKNGQTVKSIRALVYALKPQEQDIIVDVTT